MPVICRFKTTKEIVSVSRTDVRKGFLIESAVKENVAKAEDLEEIILTDEQFKEAMDSYTVLHPPIKRNKGGLINVKSSRYGAKVNDSADDTQAIQDAVEDNPGGNILIPGVAIVSSITATRDTAVTFKGFGSGVSRLRTLSDKPIIVYDTSMGDIYYAEVSDLGFIDSNTGTRTNASGIKSIGKNQLYRSEFGRLQMCGTYTGLHFDSPGAWIGLDRILFDNNGSNLNHYCVRNEGGIGQFCGHRLTMFTEFAGFWAEAGLEGTVGDLSLYESTVDGGEYGFYIDGTGAVYASHLRLNNNGFDSNTYPIWLKNVSVIRATGITHSSGTIPFTFVGTVTDYVVDPGNEIRKE